MLIITQDAEGRFEAAEENKPGMQIVGRGASVLEAVGDFCLHAQLVQIRCNPPTLLNEYAIRTTWEDLRYRRADRRE